MNETEKLYQNAKVKPVCDGLDCFTCATECNNGKYPEFTAEKQIELIKWLAKKDCMFRVTYERDFLWCSQLEWQSSFCYEEFEESLANLVNNLWQNLPQEEKKQIKEILE